MGHHKKSVAVLERLEGRRMLAAVYPTAQEQYMVELINRARANPTAEAARYANTTDSRGNTYNGQLNEGLPAGTISTAAKQPVAINPFITDAARKHAQWMVDNDTFAHAGAGGSNPGQRIAAAGYPQASTWGENIAVNWSSQSLNPTTTVFDQHMNLFTDMPIPDRGHRTNMMNGAFREVGVGVGTGPWNYPGYGNLNSLTTSIDFASNSNLYLTGVAFRDNVKVDNFYSPGEGLPAVSVSAVRAGDNRTFTTSTWSSGGYSLALLPGTYTVTASGTGLGNNVVYNNVSVGSVNVKRDFTYSAALPATPPPATNPPAAPPVVTTAPGGGSPANRPANPTEASIRPPAAENRAAALPRATAEIVGRTLVVTGSESADSIVVRRVRQTLTVSDGVLVGTFDNRAVDLVAINGLAGDDMIRVEDVTASYIDGGYGKDTLVGGEGADSIYGSAQPDLIYGNGGDDVLVGGNGHDMIYGGDGDDRVYGGAGNDTVDAGAGNDRVYGGDGEDFLAGGNGRDALYGEAGADTIHGGNHRDYSDTDDTDTRIAIEVLFN